MSPSESPLPTPIQHVFLIMMENAGVDQVYGSSSAPYETKLAGAYAWGGDAVSSSSKIGYYATCHPSAPNYLAITSGQSLQCGSDSYNTYNVSNLGSQLQGAGLSWVAYGESMAVPCQTYDSGAYVVRHMAFPFYTDLGGSTSGSVCATHVLPIQSLVKNYSFSSTPPALTFIAPNTTDDGHSSSVATGDSWLQSFVPKLIAEPWFSSSVIFIAYDESYGSNSKSGYSGLSGGPVYFVAVSPYTKGVGAVSTNASHYNTLATIEWLLGLSNLSKAGGSAFPAMTGLFQNLTGSVGNLTAPNAPTQLRSTGSTASSLSWGWNQSGALTNDTVYLWRDATCGGGVDHVVGTGGATTSYTFSRLSSGTTYSAEVQAWNLVGSSSRSACVSASTLSGGSGGGSAAPSAPTGLSATSTSASSITWGWSQSGTVTNDTVYLWRDTSCAGGVDHVASTGGSATSYTFSGLSSTTGYSSKVVAWNLTTASPESSCASASTGAGSGSGTAPAAPTGLSATATTSSSITWGWSQSGTVTNDTVYLWRDATCAGSVDHVVSTGGAATSYVFSRLSSLTTYSARVVAWNSAGSSTHSTCASTSTSGSGLAGAFDTFGGRVCASSASATGLCGPAGLLTLSAVGIVVGLALALWTVRGSRRRSARAERSAPLRR